MDGEPAVLPSREALDTTNEAAYIPEKFGKLPHTREVVTQISYDEDDSEKTHDYTIYVFEHAVALPADLPKGYAYCGGVARNVASGLLGERTLPPRDLDVVAVADWDPDETKMSELSKKLMPEDSKHGYGVSKVELGNYFPTRDFTINEVLATKDKLYATPEALKDLADKCIRPTEYEQDSWEDHQTGQVGVSPKLAMKALRLQVEFEEMYRRGEIKGIASWQWQMDAIPLFYLALGLNKAVQQDDSIAGLFYRRLIENGTITPRDDKRYPTGESIRDLALSIRWRMEELGENPFDFSDQKLNYLDGSGDDPYVHMANEYIRTHGKKLGKSHLLGEY